MLQIRLRLSLSAMTASMTPPEGVVELRIETKDGAHVAFTRVIAGHGDAYAFATRVADAFGLAGVDRRESPAYEWSTP